MDTHNKNDPNNYYRNITEIINNLEEEITELKHKFVCFELTELKFNNMKYYDKLESKYLGATHLPENSDEVNESNQRIIKYLACQCVLISDSFTDDELVNLTEIRKKKEIINIIKNLVESTHCNEIIDIIKNIP